MKRSVVAAVTVTAVACSLGSRARHYEVAQHPAGIQVTVVTIQPQPLRGELLAVDDTSVTVLSGSRLWVAPYTAIRRINVRQGGQVAVGRRAPGERERQDLRLRSRFPQGMDAELRTRVLAVYGQATPEVVRP